MEHKGRTRAVSFLLLPALLLSLTACAPNTAPETTAPAPGTQAAETEPYETEEAQLARIRQEEEAFLRAHRDEMEALAACMLQFHGESVVYQYYPIDEILYSYNQGDHIPQEQLREHPILDAADFLHGTEVFDLLYVSDWELGSLGCVFLKALADPTGHPLYWCELIWCPAASGDPADLSEAAIEARQIAPGWYWYLEETPDGPVLGTDP